MAWSQAARDAAAAARRLHKNVKFGYEGPTSRKKMSTGTRAELAKKLRAMRAGKGPKGFYGQRAVHEAAVHSTSVRNAIRSSHTLAFQNK